MPGPGFNVDVGFDVTGSAGYTATHTTEFRFGGSSTKRTTFVTRKRIRSSFVRSVPDAKGFRPPTTYVSACAKRTSLPFLLIPKGDLYNSGVAKIYGQSVPTSGSSYGYAPPDSLFFDGVGVPSVTQNTVNRAVTECLDKLRESTIELGASIAELQDTVNGVASAAKLLGRVLVAVWQRNWKRVAVLLGFKSLNKPKVAGEAWLAYKFGILPLMSDITGLIKAFNTGLRKKDAFIRATRTVSNDVTPLFVPQLNAQWVEARQQGYVTESCYVSVYARISDSFVASMSSWGAVEPLAGLWEGLGWSFLVDWLLPVGRFLNALSGPAGLTFVSGTQTTRIVADLSYMVKPYYYATQFDGAGCRTRYQCVAIFRQVLLNFPLPWIYVKNPFSNSHVSIAAALVASIGTKSYPKH